ncbi:hypothetical protein GCM10010156_62960 [Planobispora rosea]|uniref:Secreted protein n=1 Tax=Planobispora rosea TaxID=35762 RepID=A0A8J3S372_PLARO|nr:hypothetical protein [Planobispora rosea]GGS96134.1 hypothetical protein GCM10010156_62960 [Planobispora rosea]GIH87596.1 hypothetical protein Pro02_60040 [Planobispora rosea]
MKRRTILSVTAALSSALSFTALPAHAGTTGANGCGIQPYGLIGARWAQLGGENGKLGCPTTTERDIYQNGVGWAGRRQTFARGEMAWSPKNGSKLVVAAWSDRGYAHVNWRTTDRAFDKFIVRWTSAADPDGAQQDIVGGVRGRTAVRIHTNSGYRWNIKGCDTGIFGSDCQKTWTISVTG